ncbi:uncharacterized protein PV07_12790, partial [Cladophialophora immunda]
LIALPTSISLIKVPWFTYTHPCVQYQRTFPRALASLSILFANLDPHRASPSPNMAFSDETKDDARAETTLPILVEVTKHFMTCWDGSTYGWVKKVQDMGIQEYMDKLKSRQLDYTDGHSCRVLSCRILATRLGMQAATDLTSPSGVDAVLKNLDLLPIVPQQILVNIHNRKHTLLDKGWKTRERTQHEGWYGLSMTLVVQHATHTAGKELSASDIEQKGDGFIRKFAKAVASDLSTYDINSELEHKDIYDITPMRGGCEFGLIEFIETIAWEAAFIALQPKFPDYSRPGDTLLSLIRSYKPMSAREFLDYLELNA